MAPQEKQQLERPETAALSAEPQSVHEQIASLAYALWQQRRCPDGSPEEDWFQAEKDLIE